MRDFKKIAALIISIILIIEIITPHIIHASEDDKWVKLSCTASYGDITREFYEGILHIMVDAGQMIRISIDIELAQKAREFLKIKGEDALEDVILVVEILQQGKEISRESIDIKARDLDNWIFEKGRLKAFWGPKNGFSVGKKGERKSMDIVFQDTGDYVVDFYARFVEIHSSRSRRKSKGNKESNIYTDIQEYWAHDCIISLLEHGIIQGYPDGSIRAENHITRAEMATLISNALFIEPTEEKSPFKDEIPQWAEYHIAELSKRKVFLGYPSGKFYPQNFITREEAAAVLVRAFCDDITCGELSFADTNDISLWARDCIYTGTLQEVINGYPDNTFKPHNLITRAEVFTIICKLLGYHREHM